MGDYNQDGHTDASDVPVLIAALADLNAYQAANNLTAAGLLSFGDLDGDQAITNSDLQALLALLSAASGTAGNSGGNAPASSAAAVIAIAPSKSTMQVTVSPPTVLPDDLLVANPRAWNTTANSAVRSPHPLETMMPLAVDDLLATWAIVRNRHAHEQPRETSANGNDDLLA
jgi:hypothetical protein